MTERPSTPWVWTGGYPQTITNPQGLLLAQTWDNPDMAPVTAPLICEAVNAYLAPKKSWWQRAKERVAQ